MRAPIRPSAAALALAVAVALPGAVAPALAKKTKRTPCSAHFLVDSAQALVVNGQPTLDVAGKQVTLAGMCTATASLKPIHNGWRLRAHWKSCGDLLKVRVTAPPVEGMANEALIDLLSRSLRTSRRNVCIVSGLSSRNKMIEVREVDLESVQPLAE